MNKKILQKIIASTMAFILAFANLIMIGVYATTNTLEEQSTITNNENVEFNAYFLGENKNIIHETKHNLGEEEVLYLAVNVKKGYLKSANISMLGENGDKANFKIVSDNIKVNSIEKIDTINNTITLKQINTGTQTVLEIPISSINDEIFDLSNFNKINSIKLTGSYVTNNGKEQKIEKEIALKVEWTNSAVLQLSQETKSFIPYQVGEKQGTILQTRIATGLENNALPIKEININVKVPVINNKKPQSVIVTANTLATNGKDTTGFTKDNYNYDLETGILSINVKNEVNNNSIIWKKDVKDEYIITYLYEEKIEQISVEQIANVNIEAYNNIKTQLATQDTLKIEQKEKLGNFITSTLTTTNNLNKGYLQNNIAKEISFNENLKLQISYAQLVDKIIIEGNVDNFINEKGQAFSTKVEDTNYSYYNQTIISKNKFEKVLGENGYIKILGENGEQIAIINKSSVVDQNGDYIYTYEKEVSQIKLETSKPVGEGELEITHLKNLKGSTNYSRELVKSFTNLSINTKSSAISSDTTIETSELMSNIAFIAPKTKIETSINNAKLSTVVKNENVEIRVILKTNDITCDLYKNPIVEIVLPNYIKELNLKNINLAFDDELKIRDYKTYVNNNNNIVIQVNIEGENTKYNEDNITKGANIVINTDITLNQLMPSKDDVMKVYVSNENATSYESIENLGEIATISAVQKGYVETQLKAVAPSGLVTTATISGYNSKGESVTSIGTEEKIGKLETHKEARNATITMNLINNYEHAILLNSILGVFPYEGNTGVYTNLSLNSNLTLPLTSKITLTGAEQGKVKVYYTVNENATKDVTLEDNQWTTEISNFNEIKKYLIVFEDYKMLSKESFEISYTVQIPENLEHNKNVFINYATYYSDGVEDRNENAPRIGLSTGEGAELKASISANVSDKAEVKEGEIITYTVTVENLGTQNVNNVNIKGIIPEGSKYVEIVQNEGYSDVEYKYDSTKKEYIEKVETIEPGEVYECIYNVKVKEMSTQDINLEAYAIVSADELENNIETNKITNKVVEGYFELEMTTNPNLISAVLEEGDIITYNISIRNVNMKQKTNVTVVNAIPEGTTYESARILGSDENDGRTIYDEKNNSVTWNIGTLEGDDRVVLELKVKINKIESSQSVIDIKNKALVTCSETDTVFVTSEVTNKAGISNLVASMKSNREEGTLKDNDSIEYYITVKNIGSAVATNVNVTDYIPDALTYTGTKYVIDGKEYTQKVGTDVTTLSLNIGIGQEVLITIMAKANKITDADSKRIENKVVITSNKIEDIVLDPLVHTIIRTDDEKTDESGNVEEKKYTISGLAWLDENKNGKRDEAEKTLSNIEIMLINTDNGTIVKDANGNSRIVKTNEEGKYEFNEIAKGNYRVVFLYDAGYYDVTIYHQNEVVESENSDAITMNIKLNGEDRKGAVSDNINVLSENIYNIDIGLIVNPKFDLKLDKVITKITLNTKKGTTEHEYKDSKLAKLDIPSKEIEGSNIVIEYKIRVTNEGGVAGYARKIADYLPNDLKFSSTLNDGWYAGDSGKLYNTSLSNTIIQPGETKELTLILTKSMTGENTGIINNNAEIEEAYNEQGLNDQDSTPANNINGEDDKSSADALIGVRTGQIYVYIAIVLVSMVLLGSGIYFVKKKVLDK